MSVAPPLIGTYATSAVTRGAVVTCLYRDRDCTVAVMSDATIPWPRVQPRGEQGGSGLWVNEELVKAFQTESATARMHWPVASGTATATQTATFELPGITRRLDSTACPR